MCWLCCRFLNLDQIGWFTVVRLFTLSSSLSSSPPPTTDKKLWLNSIRPLTFLNTGGRLTAIGLLWVVQTTVAVSLFLYTVLFSYGLPLPDKKPILLLSDLSPLFSSQLWATVSLLIVPSPSTEITVSNVCILLYLSAVAVVVFWADGAVTGVFTSTRVPTSPPVRREWSSTTNM